MKLQIPGKLSQINWLEQVIIPLSAILMEVLTIFPWLVFLGKWPIMIDKRDILSFPSVILLMGIAYVVTLYFPNLKWPVVGRRLLIVLTGIILIFITLRLEYASGFSLTDRHWFIRYGRVLLDSFEHIHTFALAIPFTFFIYWRGIKRAQTPILFHTLYPTFLTDLVSLVAITVIWGTLISEETVRDMTANIGIYIAGFFFFGLTALALTNLLSIRKRLKNKNESVTSLNRRWVGIVMGVISGVVILGSGIASLFSPYFVAFLGRVIGFLWSIVQKIVDLLLVPISYLVGLLLMFFQWLVSLIRRNVQSQPAETTTAAPPEIPQAPSPHLPPEAVLILKWVFFSAVIALLIFFLVRSILRNRANRPPDEFDEEHESLWSWLGFRKDLKEWLKSLLPKRSLDPQTPASAARDWDKKASKLLTIREIYERFMWYMAKVGYARKPAYTPYEYERFIKTLLPDQQQHLLEITSHYVNNRYGEISVDEVTLAALNEAWESIRLALQPKVVDRTSKKQQPQPQLFDRFLPH
ncbi:MAG: DUF4129 domain-containing protein [Dehalococcoidales bacterium]|nr:DUF4129 domain-containing protein [Dehalococcoidales bacterium]